MYPRAIQLVVEQRADVDSIVSHHLTLEQTKAAFESQANNVDDLIKSMIYPGETPAGVTLNSL